MLIITLSTIAIQVNELNITIQSPNPAFIWLGDIVFILATLFELILKVIDFVCSVCYILSPFTSHCHTAVTGNSQGIVFQP